MNEIGRRNPFWIQELISEGIVCDGDEFLREILFELDWPVKHIPQSDEDHSSSQHCQWFLLFLELTRMRDISSTFDGRAHRTFRIF
jgi:hypothetical protein